MNRRPIVSALPLLTLGGVLGGCVSYVQPAQEFRIGSATSKNLFVDSAQFANRVVRLRLRNSSGDGAIDMTRLRGAIESGLRSAGYQPGDQGAGIVLDVNLYFMNTVAVGRRQVSNEIGVLLGGVAGYEIARRPGGVSGASGAILGAIAGSTLQDVLRTNPDYDSYLAICDVNLGVVKQENRRRDVFTIGGNRVERQPSDTDPTFDAFAMRETLKVSVYAGDRRDRRAYVYEAIQDRLARVVANII